MLSTVYQRMIAYGLGAGIATFVVLAVTTTIIPNPIFPREEAVRTFDYIVLGAVTLLATALGATYAIPKACSLQRNTLFSGGILSFLAIGCPVCNVAVVALIGTVGALAWFAPVQPILGLAAIGMLMFALAVQIRDIRRSQGELQQWSVSQDPRIR
jgi:hypothetical protein